MQPTAKLPLTLANAPDAFLNLLDNGHLIMTNASAAIQAIQAIQNSIAYTQSFTISPDTPTPTRKDTVTVETLQNKAGRVHAVMFDLCPKGGAAQRITTTPRVAIGIFRLYTQTITKKRAAKAA